MANLTSTRATQATTATTYCFQIAYTRLLSFLFFCEIRINRSESYLDFVRVPAIMNKMLHQTPSSPHISTSSLSVVQYRGCISIFTIFTLLDHRSSPLLPARPEEERDSVGWGMNRYALQPRLLTYDTTVVAWNTKDAWHYTWFSRFRGLLEHSSMFLHCLLFRCCLTTLNIQKAPPHRCLCCSMSVMYIAVCVVWHRTGINQGSILFTLTYCFPKTWHVDDDFSPVF